MCHGNFPIQRLLNYLPKDMNRVVWDLGCGRGEVSYLIKALSGLPWINHQGQPQIIGFDKSPGNVEWCQDSGVYSAVYQRDLEGFCEWQGEYPRPSLIVLTEVAEHLHKPQAMRLIQEVCKVSPHVLISAPYQERRLGPTHLWKPDGETAQFLRDQDLNVEVQPYVVSGGVFGWFLMIYDLFFTLPKELIAWR
jgi:trans-aconitate methyltransferase